MVSGIKESREKDPDVKAVAVKTERRSTPKRMQTEVFENRSENFESEVTIKDNEYFQMNDEKT